jgi:hypothetical protein
VDEERSWGATKRVFRKPRYAMKSCLQHWHALLIIFSGEPDIR